MSPAVKYYVVCPCCGRRLCKAVPGSEIETECPKCSRMIRIRINLDLEVNTKILEEKAV